MSTPDQLPPTMPYPAKSGGMLSGCLYGCLAVFVGMLVLAGVAMFAAYSFFSGVLDDFTSTSPRDLPAATVSQEQRDLLFGQLDMYANALEGKASPLPVLELSADDINYLLREYPVPNTHFNWLRVDIVENALRGELSLPLDEFGLPGRYLNGSGALLLTLTAGQLQVNLQSLELDGNSLPIQLLSALKEVNLAGDVNLDPQSRAALERIQSIIVRDGKLVVTPVS